MENKIKVRLKSLFWIWALMFISMFWWMIVVVENIMKRNKCKPKNYWVRLKTSYKQLWNEMTETWDALLTGVRTWK